MGEHEELFKRFKGIETHIVNMSGIVQNGQETISEEEAELFNESVNNTIETLNELKLDVLEFYNKR